MPGFHVRAAQTRSATTTRQTLEAGLSATDLTPRELAFAGDAADTYVPRPGSPSKTLAELAFVSSELSSAPDDESMVSQLSRTKGTTTTTDWAALSHEELTKLCTVCDSESEAAYVFDSDGQGSLEVICDNCRGVGHFKRVCPSAKKYRSLDYVLALLQSKKDKFGNEPPRRPPPRGQRAPFRAMPRRFQARNSGNGGIMAVTGRDATPPGRLRREKIPAMTFQ